VDLRTSARTMNLIPSADCFVDFIFGRSMRT
jgi:hypothetical protein